MPRRKPHHFNRKPIEQTGQALVRKKQKCSECGKQRPPSWFTRDVYVCDDCMSNASHARKERPSISIHAGVKVTTPRVRPKRKEYPMPTVRKIPPPYQPSHQQEDSPMMLMSGITPASPAPANEVSDLKMAPHAHVLVPIPPDRKIPLEKRCGYRGQGDEKHQPCRGKWQPWTAFNKNDATHDGLQSQCRACVALYKRLKRALGTPKPKRVTSKQDAVVIHEQEAVKENPAPEIGYARPSLDEFHRVGEYLIRMKIGSEELLRLKDRLNKQDAQIAQLIRERDVALAELAAAKTNSEAIRGFKEAEQAALALAEEAEKKLAETNVLIAQYETLIASQREYQKTLIQSGMRIRKQYRLFTDDEFSALEEELA